MRIFREKRLNKIIATLAINPFILAIPFTVLLFYLLPVEFIRFKVELIDEESTSNQYYFYDLDFDGDTEVLMFGYYRPPNIQPNIIFYETPRSQRIINQINLDDDFVENARPIFADYNHDSIAEAYIFQKTDTAIYITGIQFNDTKTDLVKFRKKHINLTYKRKGYEKLQNHEIINGHPTDLNGDGYDEIIFAVVGLFVAKPREICAFDIKNDTIFRTPKMAARLESNIKILHHPFLSDKWIFTMNTGTPANYKESEDIIDDSCGWAMAFDEKLNLWFQPIPNKVGFNYQVNTVPFQENDQAGIIALFKTPAGSIEEVEEKPEVLRKYDLKGNILSEKTLPISYHYFLLQTNEKPGEMFWLAKYYPTEMVLINSNFEEIKSVALSSNISLNRPDLSLFQIDLTGDDHKEIITTSLQDKILIYTSDFQHPVEIPYKYQYRHPFAQQVRLKKNGYPLLHLSNGGQKLLYKYSSNPFYYFKYLIIAGIYLLSAIFFYYLFRLQRQVVQKRYEAERQLYRHQMLSIKNQVDPHFTLNAINNISAMYLSGRSAEANAFLTKFSRLIHRSLMDSDKIETTIGEEIDFVKDYLDIQKIRFRDTFEYNIQIEDEKLMATKIPRQLIHTFAENAIKHGLRQNGSGGYLKIEISERELMQVQITIDDNGIGREQAAKDNTSSTGKGVSIVEQIIDLYRKIKGKKVSFKVIDKIDEGGNALGTLVDIEIH